MSATHVASSCSYLTWFIIPPSSPKSHGASLHNPRHDCFFFHLWFYNTLCTSFWQLYIAWYGVGTPETCVEWISELRW